MRRFNGGIAHGFAVALSLTLVSCSSKTTTPTQRPASLSFTVTPNPVPSTVSTLCINSVGPTKVWIYTLKIDNTGDVDYQVATWTQTYTGGGLPTSVVLPADANNFGSVFGRSTITAAGSVQATLCAGPGSQFDNASFTWTVAGANGGGTFTSASVRMLP